VDFSAGGDGGRKPPEHQAQFAHVNCGSQRLPNKLRFMNTRLVEHCTEGRVDAAARKKVI
jgi:hypothetical protein